MYRGIVDGRLNIISPEIIYYVLPIDIVGQHDGKDMMSRDPCPAERHGHLWALILQESSVVAREISPNFIPPKEIRELN